jgi:predicted small secreted protein
MKTMIVSALLLITLSACNTFSGVGRDLKQAGSAIQNAAD